MVWIGSEGPVSRAHRGSWKYAAQAPRLHEEGCSNIVRFGLVGASAEIQVFAVGRVEALIDAVGIDDFAGAVFVVEVVVAGAAAEGVVA